MNRRNFLKGLAAAAASFSILPAATTYKRSRWTKVAWVKREESGVYTINPEWVIAPYEMEFFEGVSPITNPPLSARRFCLEGVVFVEVPMISFKQQA
jgi:hypothetical protein